HLEHELWIVGNARYRAGAILKKARALGLEERIRFLGYVPRADLPRLYSGATGLVYPSLLEGFGLPIVEAMACGAPVITSNNSSMREVAGEAAVLVDPCDVREMTEAMTRLAEDQSLRQELSARGLKRAGEFSWRKTAELTVQAYREALELPQHSPPLRGGEYGAIAASIHKTIEYARLFEYPLISSELHERLFDVQVDQTTFQLLFDYLE